MAVRRDAVQTIQCADSCKTAVAALPSLKAVSPRNLCCRSAAGSDHLSASVSLQQVQTHFPVLQANVHQILQQAVTVSKSDQNWRESTLPERLAKALKTSESDSAAGARQALELLDFADIASRSLSKTGSPKSTEGQLGLHWSLLHGCCVWVDMMMFGAGGPRLWQAAVRLRRCLPQEGGFPRVREVFGCCLLRGSLKGVAASTHWGSVKAMSNRSQHWLRSVVTSTVGLQRVALRGRSIAFAASGRVGSLCPPEQEGAKREGLPKDSGGQGCCQRLKEVAAAYWLPPLTFWQGSRL